MRRSGRVFRVLLRAYPRSTRDRLGDDMAQLFADQLRDAGGSRAAVAAVWLRTVIDILRSAPGAHLPSRTRQLADGPVAEDDDHRRLLPDMVSASVPSLMLLLLSLGSPQAWGTFDWPAAITITITACGVGQWLAAWRAVRAATVGSAARWLLACVALSLAILWLPAFPLILINLRI